MAWNRQRVNGWRRWIPTTVVGQLVFGTVIAQIAVLLSFSLFEIYLQDTAQRGRDQPRVEQQASLLASLAAEPLLRNDTAQLSRLTEAMRASSAVRTARITDLQGNTLAVNHIGDASLNDIERSHLNTALSTSIFKTFPRNDLDHEAIAPVVFNGKTIGVVWIYSDVHRANRSLNAVVWASVAYACVAIAANVLLLWFLGRKIVRPLARLSKATQQVIRDTEDTRGFPLPVTSRNEGGQLTHSFNSMVRELQTQRAGLQETLALLDSMLENAPVGFAFFDRKNRYVRANHFLERMYGNTMHEHLGQTMQEIFPGPIAQQLEMTVNSVFETGQDVHDIQLRGLLQSGEAVRDDESSLDDRSWICNFYPVRATHGKVRWVGMVMVEVTGRVRQEEAMRRSEKLAAAGRLAASIAHEINNPLEAVTNLLYLIRQHPSLDHEALEYASLAQHELARVSEITQQTLRFYRASSRAEELQLADIANSVLALHGARIHTAQVQIKTRLDHKAHITGFSGELRQVLANLVGNAVDAMPTGGTLHVRITRLGETHVCICVADTGIGMSENVRKRIFEPFFTTKEATGTGLGLWVSEEIVVKHSGTLRVKSRAGKGTVFRMILPVNQSTERATTLVNDAAQV